MTTYHSDKDFTKAFDFEIVKQKMNCQIHGEIEFDIPKFKCGELKASRCPRCEEARRLIEQAEVLEKAKLERLKKTGVRVRYFDSSFGNYKPINKKALGIINELKKAVETKSNKSFLLYGNSGTGKTHLCSVAVAELGGLYRTWEWISLDIRSSYASSAKETEADIMRKLCTVPFLVIDEIDKGVDSEAKKSTLSFICRERYENCLPIWLAGNCNGEWVQNMIDTSVLDRLKQSGRSLCFDWESYRPKLKD